MKVNQVKVMVLKNLQKKGIDFHKDYFAQSFDNLDMIGEAMKGLHYRQSSHAKAMGRTNRQSFYYSMQNLAEKKSRSDCSQKTNSFGNH